MLLRLLLQRAPNPNPPSSALALFARAAMSSAGPAKRPRVAQRVRGEMGGGGAKLWGEITELARQPNIVSDLGQGFPDFEGDAVARAAARSAGDLVPRLNQYSLVNGTLELRSSLSSYYAACYPGSPKLDANAEVLVTSSGTESLYVALSAMIEPGDEVVVFEPCFPWYAPVVRLAGGVVKCVPLRYPEFAIDEKELRAAFSPRTRVVVFNTPHNPTGHVARQREVDLIAELCLAHDALCLSDEVYEHFIFPHARHAHLRMCDAPHMRDRTLTVGSASKMFSLTGWRVGWLYGPADLIAASRSLHSFTSYCAPTPLQEGVRQALDAAAALPRCRPAALPALNAQFAENAALLADALKRRFGVTASLPEGGYFLVVDVAASGKTDAEFAAALARERGVVCIPMSVFYPQSPVNNLVRFSVCKTRAVIDKAVKGILG
jgi:N-succinyldiaminopimelate aminotransferase